VNTFQGRTLVNPENFLPHLLAPMVNLLVCAPVIPNGVETTSGGSSSVYTSTGMIRNYLAPVLYEGSLTSQTEDGHSSFVGRVMHSTCDRMSYSCLPALHDLSSGSHPYVLSLGLHPLPTGPFWCQPLQLLGHSYLLFTLRVFVDKSRLTHMKYVPLPLTPFLTICLQASVTLCAVVQFTRFHLHMVPGGFPSSILPAGYGRTDGCDL